MVVMKEEREVLRAIKHWWKASGRIKQLME